MTVKDDNSQAYRQTRRTWREHLVLPMLVAGGLLTVVWIAILIAAVLQIISAVAGTGGHG